METFIKELYIANEEDDIDGDAASEDEDLGDLEEEELDESEDA
jgi:hypothetical protein